MKSNFLGATYQAITPVLGTDTCINLYAERRPDKQTGEVGAFIGTPGKAKIINVGSTGQGRALVPLGINFGVLVAVVGNTVYEVDLVFPGPYNQTKVTTIGTLPDSTGAVDVVSNYTQAAVATSQGIYWWTQGTPGLSLVAGTNPNLSPGVIPPLAYLDGYGCFVLGGGGVASPDVFGVLNLGDLSTFNALNVAEAEALPDGINNIISTLREIWILGSESIEIWSDTGAAAFPFERIPGGVLGIGSGAGAALLDGTIYWMTPDYKVARSVGYQFEYISTPSVELALRRVANNKDLAVGLFKSKAYTYKADGHAFYVLNAGPYLTLVYDATTGLWHQRAARTANGALVADIIGPILDTSAPFYSGLAPVLALGQQDGNIYALDPGTYTDNGNPIYRERTWQVMDPQEINRIRIDRLELDAETGVGNETGTDTDPQVWLDMSFDGGRTFGTSRYQSLGKVGIYNNVPTWKRCGMGRRPVARLATTAQVKIAWAGVNLSGEVLQQ